MRHAMKACRGALLGVPGAVLIIAHRPSERVRAGGERMRQLSHIEIGYRVYLVEGGGECGAGRGYLPEANALAVYVENAGDFVVPLDAARRVHDGKVVPDAERLDERLRRAIAHAHDREKPGAYPSSKLQRRSPLANQTGRQ